MSILLCATDVHEVWGFVPGEPDALGHGVVLVKRFPDVCVIDASLEPEGRVIIEWPL